MSDWASILDEIRNDRRSGATAIVRRAGDVFRLIADDLVTGDASYPATLPAAASAVATVRPAFGGLRRLANDVLAALDVAAGPEQAGPERAGPERAGRLVRAAVDTFMRQVDLDAERLVEQAAHLLDHHASRIGVADRSTDRRLVVLTISASSLVERALLRLAGDRRFAVICLESRPMLEGAALARRLAEAGLSVTLAVDALGPSLVGEAGLVLIGADTLAPGGLVHKVGTFGLALAAQRSGTPIYTLTGPEKLLPTVPEGALRDGGSADELIETGPNADRPPTLLVRNPYFDLTPLDLLTGIVFPDGVVGADVASSRAGAIGLHASLVSPDRL